MKYREKERERATAIRDSLFKDPGNGVFLGKPRDFVLEDPSLNLWEGIREDALQYFRDNGIGWWHSDNEPTGHLLSSQVACINHLYFIRQRQDLATAVLRKVNPAIQEALIVDDGYVEFEFIGEKQYVPEKSWTRGANCTSIDAVMIGQTATNQKIMFLIEWKYTESYIEQDKYIQERYVVYDDLITNPNSPFVTIKPQSLYYEPFYQLMRQTILGWKLTENLDHGCEDYLHLHVIPDENLELRMSITSPGLQGKDISDAWKKVLKRPDKYLCVSPKELLSPCINEKDTHSALVYLEKRYW